jgi:hypothetical protein
MTTRIEMIIPQGHDQLVGLEVPATDGSNYGYRVLDYNTDRGEYLVQSIRWSDGKDYPDPPQWMDRFKFAYHYRPDAARTPLKAGQ